MELYLSNRFWHWLQDWQWYFAGFEFAGDGRQVSVKHQISGEHHEEGQMKQALVEALKYRYRDLGHLLAWSIQQGLTVGEMLQMPYYHPVIEEALQAALYDLYTKVEAKNPGAITEVRPL